MMHRLRPMAAEPRTRTPNGGNPSSWAEATAPDGTPIAWTADGPLARRREAIVLCNGIACSDAYWYGIAPRLARSRAVIRWDYRGHGRSGDPIDRSEIGPDAFVADLRTVLDAAGIDRAVLVGHSYGVQVVLEAYRLFPERVAALVAVAGASGRPLSRGRERDTRDALLAGVRRFAAGMPQVASKTWEAVWDSPSVHRLARVLGGTTAAAPPEVMRQYFAHVRDRDPELLLEMMEAMQQHRADDLLPTLDAPLLVLAGDRDGLTPLAVLRAMALSAPRGELAIRHGAAHTLPAEHPAWVAGEIDRFLRRHEGTTGVTAPDARNGSDVGSTRKAI